MCPRRRIRQENPRTKRIINWKCTSCGGGAVIILHPRGRANPYFLFFDNEGELLEGNLEIQAKQVSLFPILPAVSWNFSF